MSARDRLAVMAIVVLAVLGVVWITAVSPARKEASKIGAEVSAVRGQLAVVQGEISNLSSSQQRYRTAYALLARLGKAVPTSAEVPSLVYAIDRASNSKNVEFTSITNGASGSGSGSSGSGSGSSGSGSGSSGSGSGSSGSGSGSSASAATSSSSFRQMPFTFVFEGTYTDLLHLLGQIEGFTVQTPTGALRVSGRLLTIQSITLGAKSGGEKTGSTAMTWTITATAYVLSAAQETGGASASTAASGSAAGSAGAGARSTSSSAGGGSRVATTHSGQQAPPAVVGAMP